MTKVGADIETKINWAGTRLICIAADFTRYDEHAVTQIGRNIELQVQVVRPELLLLELVNAHRPGRRSGPGEPKHGSEGSRRNKTARQTLDQSPPELKDLYVQLEAFLVGTRRGVQTNATQTYIAFRRIKNFACVAASPKYKILLV